MTGMVGAHPATPISGTLYKMYFNKSLGMLTIRRTPIRIHCKVLLTPRRQLRQAD